MDVRVRYSPLMAELEVDAVSFKVRLQKLLHGQIDFVPQLDRNQSQLLFSVVPARIVVQAQKETTDKQDKKDEDHDMDQLLALHHTSF